MTEEVPADRGRIDPPASQVAFADPRRGVAFTSATASPPTRADCRWPSADTACTADSRQRVPPRRSEILDVLGQGRPRGKWATEIAVVRTPTKNSPLYAGSRLDRPAPFRRLVVVCSCTNLHRLCSPATDFRHGHPGEEGSPPVLGWRGTKIDPVYGNAVNWQDSGGSLSPNFRTGLRARIKE